MKKRRDGGREGKQQACFPARYSDIICSELKCCLTKQMFLLKYLTVFSKNLLLFLKIVTQLSHKCMILAETL